MKKVVFYILVIIGVICSISKITRFYINEKTTREYWRNCEKVEIGMSLDNARKIIGDAKYQYWTQDHISGEIIISSYEDELKYTLEYPMVFAGSDNMRLEFDPITLSITDVFCGE